MPVRSLNVVGFRDFDGGTKPLKNHVSFINIVSALYSVINLASCGFDVAPCTLGVVLRGLL